jgi:two-component system chemotaxis response regulator CheB
MVIPNIIPASDPVAQAAMRVTPIRVVVVDDSRLMREMLQAALTEAGDIIVVGAAADPLDARGIIRETNPDVVTLDVEMPGMGGIEFLRRIMELRPVPVVMVAGGTTLGAEITLNALEIGAVDFVAKPSGGAGWSDFAATVRYKVREAAQVRFNPPARTASPTVQPGAGADSGLAPANGISSAGRIARPVAAAAAHRGPVIAPRHDLIAVGASTGGVTAINRLLARLTVSTPPMVIVQHMPMGFTARFAERLARTTGLDVAEAVDREILQRGMIRIAPGDRHLRVARQGERLVCQVSDDPLVGGHRPSVDVLFSSVAAILRQRALGVILTGMGSDGAKGLMQMRAAGAHTLGEAETSCTIYGMPKAAMRLGAVAEELDVDSLSERLRSFCAGNCSHPETMR